MTDKVIVVGDPEGREKVVELGEEEVDGEERVGFGREVGGAGRPDLVVEDDWTGCRKVFQREEVIVRETRTTVYHDPIKR